MFIKLSVHSSIITYIYVSLYIILNLFGKKHWLWDQVRSIFEATW